MTPENQSKLDTEAFDTLEENYWCPGCGNFGIRRALVQALVDLGIPPARVVITTGIGQAPKMNHHVKCNGLDGIHGRALPEGLGAQLVNPEFSHVCIDGDGGAYAEGTNHFLHALRRNPDMLYMVHNNQVFGLTKGQASPTSLTDFTTSTSPDGTKMPAFNPVAVALANHGTWVARGFAGDGDHLTGLIKAGLQHEGFAFLDVLQPCVSFNRVNTYKWYKDRVYHLVEEDHDPHDLYAAFRKSWEFGKRIPIGLFYEDSRPAFHAQFSVLQRGPVTQLRPDLEKIRELLAGFR